MNRPISKAKHKLLNTFILVISTKKFILVDVWSHSDIIDKETTKRGMTYAQSKVQKIEALWYRWLNSISRKERTFSYIIWLFNQA